ncbi:MAG: signal peptidase II [Candidatus Omnitrophota bacterium]|jgi:signal peptidase II|nr:signal peptidase II [Candidatus Omnitrophota bacterium]MDD5518295.1 signal peptidase II [Candidatus Omnitrophota bacterium]
MASVIIVFVILLLDQLSKAFISGILQLNQTIPLIKGVFGLTLVHNRGAAFGLFRNQVYLFIITSITAIVLIYFGLKDNRHNKYYVVSLSLILAGAIGNLIDRLRLGYVIDFLNFYIWPVFNVADSSITIGAVLLGWAILRKK